MLFFGVKKYDYNSLYLFWYLTIYECLGTYSPSRPGLFVDVPDSILNLVFLASLLNVATNQPSEMTSEHLMMEPNPGDRQCQ